MAVVEEFMSKAAGIQAGTKEQCNSEARTELDAGLKSTGLEMVQWHGGQIVSEVRNLQKGKGSQGIYKGHTSWKAGREEKPQGRSRPQKGIRETQRERASGVGEGKLARGCWRPQHSVLLQSPGNDSKVEAPRDRDKAATVISGAVPRELPPAGV